MLRIDTMLRTNWTRTKPTHSTWPRRLVTRRRQTWPSASRMAKKQRLTPLLLLPLKPRRPLRPPGTTPRVMCPYIDLNSLRHRPPTSLRKQCLIKSSCLIHTSASQPAITRNVSRTPRHSCPNDSMLFLSFLTVIPTRGASRHPRQATCLARASQPKKKKWRKSKKAKGAVLAEAAAPDIAAVAPTHLVHPPQHRMHIHCAHSMILGRNKELYYLIVV
jgi:hypothetical protein